MGVEVECTACGRTITLPPATGDPGRVLLAPLAGWEMGTEDGRWYRRCADCLAKARQAAAPSGGVVTVSGPEAALALRAMEEALRERRPTVRVSLDVAALAARGELESDLHRCMAALGYTVELLSGDGGPVEEWLFVHPDGPAP